MLRWLKIFFLSDSLIFSRVCEAMANPTDNLSAVLHKIDDLRLEQVPLPPKPGNNGKFCSLFFKFNSKKESQTDLTQKEKKFCYIISQMFVFI